MDKLNGWGNLKVGEFAEIKHGYPYKSTYWSNNETSRILVTPVNFKLGGGFLNNKINYYSETGPCPQEYILQQEDLVITMTDLRKDGGTLGYPALIPNINGKVFFHNQRIGKVIIQDKNVFKKFIFYLFCTSEYRKYILSTASGTTVNHTSPSRIQDYDCTLPPLPEQKKIAEILSTVDEQIEQTDALIEKTKELKKGLMQQLLTRGIGHTRFKKTELGEIPEEWEVKSIYEVAEIINGGTPSRSNVKFWSKGEIPWATPTDITSTDNKYITNTKDYITEMGLQGSSANLLPAGSILMTSRATIGEACINTVPMATNQGFKSIVCKQGFHNELMYYLISTIKDKLIQLAGGSTFLEVSKNDVSYIKIPVPLLEEQIKIAEILSTTDNELDIITNERSKLLTLKQGLMQKLLTGRIRVKV